MGKPGGYRYVQVAGLLMLGACAHVPLSMLDEEGGARARVPLTFGAAGPRVAETPSPDPAGTLTLAEAYRRALTRSERVAISSAQIEMERITRRTNRDLAAPTATLSGSAVLRRERVVGTGDNRQVIQTGRQALFEGVVIQPLFRRGFLSTLAAGDRGIEAAEASNLREEQILAHDVASTFFGVLKARKFVEITKLEVERDKGQLDNAIARAKSGTALRNAELQARANLKRDERHTVEARRDVIIAEAHFARVVGEAPPAQLEIPSEPAMPPLDQALAQAHERPDISALSLRAEEARAFSAAATARRWWPRVDVVGTVDYFVPQVFSRNIEWSVLGTVTIPLYEANQHTDAVVRRNDLRIAELEREQQVRVVDEEVASAIALVTGSQEGTKLATEQLAAARDLYALVDKQLKINAVTYLEVSNAMDVLVMGERAFEISSIERLEAIYQYLYATGALDLTNEK